MKKILCLVLFLLLLIPSFSDARTGSKYSFIWVYGTIGGATGDLDAVQCDDIRGDGATTVDPLRTGDAAIGMYNGKMTGWIFNEDSTDSESSPAIIVPDDRADCINTGEGAWEQIDLESQAATILSTLLVTGAITASGGIITSSDTPVIYADDNQNAGNHDFEIDVDYMAGDTASVAQLGVWVDAGIVDYVELDGVNDRIELKVATQAEAGITVSGLTDMGSGTAKMPTTSSGDQTLTIGMFGLKADEDLFVTHGGAAGEIQTEVGISLIQHSSLSFDPAGVYDQESTYRSLPLFYIGDDFPHGLTIVEWKLLYVGGDPDTELDADLICDTTPDFNSADNATVMDVLNTASGASTADSGFDSASCANGSYIYIHFGADPTDANVFIAFDLWYYAEED